MRLKIYLSANHLQVVFSSDMKNMNNYGKKIIIISQKELALVREHTYE